MAVNSTRTRTRSNARAGITSATPAVSARRTRPGRFSPTPLRAVPIAGSKPKPSASAAEVVQAYLKVQVATLRSLEPKVRADEFDSVHQMRVATRRLRATLRSFGTVIPRSATEKAAGDLKWLGGLLGEARDGEVLPQHLLASLEAVSVELLIGPVQARIQGHFAPLRASAREVVIKALDSERYAVLLGDLDQLAHDPPRGPQAAAPARDVLPAAVHKAYRQAKRRMRRARQAPRGQARDVALHEARKSARRTRYAAEAARPASGKPARTFARQMKKVQSVVGDHQDTVIARQAARDLGIGAHLAGENAFTYGLLHEREHDQAERLQARARTVWKKASRPRHRTWMR
jgi:CHAD domain-containing protein